MLPIPALMLTVAAAFAAHLREAPLEGGKDVPIPKRISGKDPSLPGPARAAGVQGYLVFEITVGVDGRMTAAKVIRALPLLDVTAIEAMKGWRFEPTIVDGTPRPVKFRQTIDMFFSTGDALKAYGPVAADSKVETEWRVLAVEQIAKYAERDRKAVIKLLTPVAQDADPAVAKAAASALAALPPEKK
jgi:TonB family protein